MSSRLQVGSSRNIPAAHLMGSFIDRRALWLATAVLLLIYGLALTSMAQKAPTFDEQGFIVRGLAYLRGYSHIRVGHPLGLNALNAALLASDDSVALPLDDPSWSGSSFHRPAELFLWGVGNDVEHIMFLARLPTLWLGLLLSALAGRWAWQLGKRDWVGVLALIFVGLDPNFLAHMRLATTDLGLAAFALLAAYMLWRFLLTPSWSRTLLAGAAFGLLLNTKFTAALFIPLFALVIVLALGQRWIHRKRSLGEGSSWLAAFPGRPLLMLVVAYPAAGLLALWVTNGFDVSTMPADLPLLASLTGRTVPLAHFFEQLLDIGGRLQVNTPSFLLGQYSDTGWWYYFPVAFLLKTPLPTLFLFVWAAWIAVHCLIARKGPCLPALDNVILLIPALGYFLIALTSDINLGYRHLLPVLPFLVIFSAATSARPTATTLAGSRMAVGAVLAFGLLIVAITIYPHFLAYFNVLAGGPDNGWRSLVDSNLDWGQDLDDLPHWMEENEVDSVWLSYFGEARPEYYGIAYRGLDSFPPRLMDPQGRPFAPAAPAPGVYAISATNLQGVHFADHDQFAWFREREPMDKLGYSLFLYDVPPSGAPASLLLAGLQVDDIEPADYALLGTNDVQAYWFDLDEAIVIPRKETLWFARAQDQEPPPQLLPFVQGRMQMVAESGAYTLGRYDPPELSEGNLAEFVHAGGRLRLQDVDLVKAGNGTISLVTQWRQLGDAQPLKLFVHAIDGQGQLAAQWDGLGAHWRSWRSGDALIQLHTLTLPDHLPLESLQLRLGVYDPLTGQRWITPTGSDYFQLQE